jgi:tRNA threonylcarbamoyladenosine dehydratase
MSVPLEYERNLGFFTEEEQHALGESVVAIGGAGGDGGMLAIQLARMGVGSEGGEIRLADPDPFEAENTNRQASCNVNTVGVNKALAVADDIRAINPNIGVRTYTEGVTQGNIGEFVSGADLLIDETEFTMHGIGVALARQARAEGVPNMHVINVGFGAQLTSYGPNSRYTLERRLGLSDKDSIEEISKAEVGIDKWLAWMPPYADLNAFKVVASGKKSAPSVGAGVALAASMGATEAALHLTRKVGNNRPDPTIFPYTKVQDTMAGYAGTVRHPRIRFTASFAKMALRSTLNMNPKTDY